MPTTQQAVSTQPNSTPPPDLAEQILRAAPVDDSARADAWDAFHQSQNEEDLTGRLQKLSLPQSVKADLWDAKHSGKAPNNTGAIGGSPVDMKTGAGSDAQNPGAASRFISGALDEAGNAVAATGNAIRQTIGGAIAPPQDAHETAIYATGGQVGLAAYRAANKVVESAQNLVESKKENFHQAATDFVRTAQDLHSGQWRQGLSDAGSTVGDLAALNPTTAPGTGERIKEVSEGSRPGGDLASPLGKTAADLGMAYVGEKAPEIVKAGGKAVEGVNDIAGRAANKINTTELRPEWLVKRPETPEPQHGAPVKVETPLDSASISKSLGGKNLSNDAVKTLQSHVGEKIPVGSTPKTQALAAAEPVQNLISETSSKMNRIVRDAPQFTTNIETDAGFGNNNLTSEIEAIKKNLPASEKLKLSQDADAVLEDASEILKSTDPAKVVEYRRQLGNSIDWENISKNPETPKEVQNATRAKVYRAITDKIHSEVPETVALDKIMQPNLELRSHLRNRLGDRAFEDVHAATAESQEQAKLGKQKIENDLHNAQVAKNWQKVKYALITAGVGEGLLTQFKHFLGE
jgi:hypothetical protein